MKWVVMRLVEDGHDVEKLTHVLRAWFGVEVHIFEGYALVSNESQRLHRLPRQVDRAMRLPNGALLQISDAEKKRLMRGHPIQRGELVTIEEGPFRGMQGRIVSVREHQVSVRVRLRSVRPIVTVPITGVKVCAKS
jgi:transcription antitermination factor NusG